MTGEVPRARRPKTFKAYLLVFLVFFIGFSCVTRFSYIPYTFKTGYVDMRLPSDMDGPTRAFYLGVAIFNQMNVVGLLAYMSIYEAIFLETKPYFEPVNPHVFVINPAALPRRWDREPFVYFDWDKDGFAESVAWPPKGAQVLLFGKVSRPSSNARQLLAVSTVPHSDALTDMDVNHDGVLDKRDPAFAKINIWRVVAPADVQGADIRPVTDMYRSINLTQDGAVTISALDGETFPLALPALKTKRFNSYYLGPMDFDLDAVRLHLPKLRGYGTLMPLSAAMSQDGVLKQKIVELSKCNLMDVFSYPEVTNQQITDILFRWAKVDGIDPKSRGPFIDARKLAYLEVLTGQQFFQMKRWYNPRPYAAKDLEKAWERVLQEQSARLVFQTCGRPLFSSEARYNVLTDTVNIGRGMNQRLVVDLMEQAKTLPKEQQDAFVANLTFFLSTVPKLLPLDDKMFLMFF